MTPTIPKVITHKNMEPLLSAISAEPYFQPGPQTAPRPRWVDQQVILEIPLGELAQGGLNTMALLGRRPNPKPMALTGKEGFDAQGLEGKVQIEKPLFNALMNLRDLIPPHRGRILTTNTHGRKRARNMAKQTIYYVAGYNYPKGHRDRRLKFSGGEHASIEAATHAAQEGESMGYYMDVTTRRPRTWFNPSNMAHANMAGGRRKSSARSRLGKRALTKPVAVTTIADLGHAFDPEAFYSVKGGKLSVRHRRPGKGLGKATTIGTIPGFRRGTFYSVKRGVVFARRRAA